MSNEIVKASDGSLVAALSKCELSRIHLGIDPSCTFDEAMAIFKTVAALGASNPWHIGDAMCQIEQRWGEKYAQAVDAHDKTGIPVETIRANQWVAGKVEFVRRRTNLSWNHHKEVAALEPKQQEKWLELAEKHEMSQRRLRHSVKAGRVLTLEEIDALSGKGSGIKGLFLENIMTEFSTDFRKWKEAEIGDISQMEMWPKRKLGILIGELERLSEALELLDHAKKLFSNCTIDV
jgi:hypothetical protein